jgi:energy-coupling factor transport system ATP-binding protein
MPRREVQVHFIELDRVSFSYPGSSSPALRDISLSIDEGEYLAVVGANGSGKSTLLRLLDGLRLPSSGELRVASRATSSEEGRKVALRTVGLVFQSPADQIVSSSVEEDVAFGPENLGLPRQEIRRRVDLALAAVGLGGERHRASHFLSAGQQQRLAIAGALAMDARCLAFDEATAMLDPEACDEVLALLDLLVGEGRTVLHVTHDMAEACRAGRVLVLDAGSIVFDGKPEALLSGALGQVDAVAALGLPEYAALARALGLEPIARESAQAIAERIAEAYLRQGENRQAGSGQSPASFSPRIVASPSVPAFELRDARHAYLRGTVNERVSLRGVDLAVPSGASLAFVGRTGSGKSTALQLLDGLVAASSGELRSFGLDLSSPGLDFRSLRMRAPLAIQRPESALFERYAGDDVAFGPRNLGLSGKALVERVREAMEEAGLGFEAFRDRQTRGLSGGEKRRLALAGVLAMRGEALLLDEPTSALDQAAAASILAIAFDTARKGRTVVFATHSMEEAARADLVAVFSDGRVVASGAPETIFYDAFDPAWGLRRPFACAVAIELGARGFELDSRPLTVSALADAIRVVATATGAATTAAAKVSP